jgi:signal transduction histidine kinase
VPWPRPAPARAGDVVGHARRARNSSPISISGWSTIAHRRSRRSRDGGASAVPLIANDETVGILFVSVPDGATSAYTEQNLRELSIVGSLIAAYLVMADQARKLDEARHEAEAANRMKDEFLALVSHELKTPLHSMLVWTEMLRSEEMGPSGRIRAVRRSSATSIRR